MNFLTWQNPEQLFVAQVLKKEYKQLSCGIKGNEEKFFRTLICLLFVLCTTSCSNEIEANKKTDEITSDAYVLAKNQLKTIIAQVRE